MEKEYISNFSRTDIKTDRNDSEIKKLESRIFVTEMMLKAMWNLMNKNGISTDALNDELQSIMADRKTNYNALPRYACPKCGKVMQISKTNAFVANCMYCGASKPILPFGLSDDEALPPNEDPAPEVTPAQNNPFDNYFT